jgi:aspartate carbamoyltransferase regulatory subunit
MLTINSIKNGIVIDHIKSGFGIKIFNYLGLDKADYTVALIMNAESDKCVRKDIIKIENEINIDFKVLGLICPNATINIIENEIITKKLKLKLPERVQAVIRCKNPRCITNTEHNICQSFYLVDTNNGLYRCEYCDEMHTA